MSKHKCQKQDITPRGLLDLEQLQRCFVYLGASQLLGEGWISKLLLWYPERTPRLPQLSKLNLSCHILLGTGSGRARTHQKKLLWGPGPLPFLHHKSFWARQRAGTRRVTLLLHATFLTPHPAAITQGAAGSIPASCQGRNIFGQSNVHTPALLCLTTNTSTLPGEQRELCKETNCSLCIF